LRYQVLCIFNPAKKTLEIANFVCETLSVEKIDWNCTSCRFWNYEKMQKLRILFKTKID